MSGSYEFILERIEIRSIVSLLKELRSIDILDPEFERVSSNLCAYVKYLDDNTIAMLERVSSDPVRIAESITSLDLPLKVINFLNQGGVYVIDDIERLTDLDLLSIRCIGKRALLSIRSAVEAYKNDANLS